MIILALWVKIVKTQIKVEIHSIRITLVCGYYINHENWLKVYKSIFKIFPS